MQRVMLATSQLQDDIIYLRASQTHYLRRVLRLGEGDRFIALDGQGQGWVASLGPEAEVAEIVEPWQCHTELAVPLHLVIAMPKTGMDDIVRQATELGVSSICPVVSDRTILKPSPKKVDRWRRIAQEAIEQCERQWVPAIADPIPVEEALATLPTRYAQNKHNETNQGQNQHDETKHEQTKHDETQHDEEKPVKWICVARSDGAAKPPQHLLEVMLEQMPLPSLSDPAEAITSLTIAVGPEGGWTPSEVERAIALGYVPISLGPRILRAVTAPLSAIAIIAAVLDSQAPQAH